MAELANCSRCGNVFVKSIRDVCQACYKEEEEAFQVVYRFLSKRENREATMKEIIKATDVEEELITKFIKEGRLRTSDFPKLAYPCERCGVGIVRGKLCANCSDDLKNDLEHHERLKNHETEQKNGHEKIYYAFNKYKKS
ncbi:flagellar operon protein TIGR03826 [Lentibacillus halodurans]|uniref:Flagellar operon protein TIGR03826 n=1 Tax=Lentibacillus halodurans TaxID=237679 RepID=A0A1I0WJQ0_9BACI|nr:TIGR03826 family flagellar region protein [Lentibacillus halodurans]SFA88166.1 flagellar operon protein TIGR03826 [Lentibacillus halodurans]